MQLSGGRENACCSVSFSFTSFVSSSRTAGRGITALKYAFSGVFCALERGQELLCFIVDVVLRYPATFLRSVWRSKRKLVGVRRNCLLRLCDDLNSLVSGFEVGGLTCRVVVQKLKQIFFGEAQDEPFLCVVVCNILRETAAVGAAPCLPFRGTFIGSWSSGAGEGSKVAELCQVWFGYQPVVTNEGR